MNIPIKWVLNCVVDVKPLKRFLQNQNQCNTLKGVRVGGEASRS